MSRRSIHDQFKKLQGRRLTGPVKVTLELSPELAGEFRCHFWDDDADEDEWLRDQIRAGIEQDKARSYAAAMGSHTPTCTHPQAAWRYFTHAYVCGLCGSRLIAMQDGHGGTMDQTKWANSPEYVPPVSSGASSEELS